MSWADVPPVRWHVFEPYVWEPERCGYVDGDDTMCGYNADEHVSDDERQPGQGESGGDEVDPSAEDAEGGQNPADDGGDPKGKVETHTEAGTRMAGYPNAHGIATHIRVKGWCVACDGHGRLGVLHVDVNETAGERALADVVHIRRDTLRLVAAAVRLQVEARLAEIGQGSGCEATAARMFQLGRLEVIDTDMWKAVGISEDEPDLTPAQTP